MEDLTRIDDNSVVFKREGIYQARIRVDGKYVYRSLKICDNYATISCIFDCLYIFNVDSQSL